VIWETIKLGELTRIRTGKLDANKADANGIYPFFTCAIEPLAINTPAFDCKAVLVAGNGDLNVKYYEGKFNAYQRTYVIESLDENVLLPKYLYLFLNAYVGKLRSLAIGGVIKYIKLSNLTDAPIPIPPLIEQQRISAILEKATYIKHQCELALENIDFQEQSIFTELFGDGQSILKNWPNKPLGELLDFMTSGSRGWAAYYADQGEKFLRIQNVTNNELNLEDIVFVSPPESAEANRTAVKAGDVLLSITADLGRTAVIPDSLGKAYINQHLAILRTSKISPIFLSGFLSSPCGKMQIQSKNRGGVKAGLNFNDIRSFVIPIPDSNLIAKYESYLSKIRLLKKQMIESLHKSYELAETIQHQQFAKQIS